MMPCKLGPVAALINSCVYRMLKYPFCRIFVDSFYKCIIILSLNGKSRRKLVSSVFYKKI